MLGRTNFEMMKTTSGYKNTLVNDTKIDTVDTKTYAICLSCFVVEYLPIFRSYGLLLFKILL